MRHWYCRDSYLTQLITRLLNTFPAINRVAPLCSESCWPAPWCLVSAVELPTNLRRSFHNQGEGTYWGLCLGAPLACESASSCFQAEEGPSPWLWKLHLRLVPSSGVCSGVLVWCPGAGGLAATAGPGWPPSARQPCHRRVQPRTLWRNPARAGARHLAMQ